MRENDFTLEQREQIQMGEENGIDVIRYARPEFTADQMKMIRVGLEHGFDVNYDKPKYSSEIMVILKESYYFGIQDAVKRIIDKNYSALMKLKDKSFKRYQNIISDLFLLFSVPQIFDVDVLKVCGTKKIPDSLVASMLLDSNTNMSFLQSVILNHFYQAFPQFKNVLEEEIDKRNKLFLMPLQKVGIMYGLFKGVNLFDYIEPEYFRYYNHRHMYHLVDLINSGVEIDFINDKFVDDYHLFLMKHLHRQGEDYLPIKESLLKIGLPLQVFQRNVTGKNSYEDFYLAKEIYLAIINDISWDVIKNIINPNYDYFYNLYIAREARITVQKGINVNLITWGDKPLPYFMKLARVCLTRIKDKNMSFSLKNILNELETMHNEGAIKTGDYDVLKSKFTDYFKELALDNIKRSVICNICESRKERIKPYRITLKI